MVGFVGFNLNNQNGGVGRELWAMTLRDGGGNPGMKVNPIYVKETESEEKVSTEEISEEKVDKADEDAAEEVSEDIIEESSEDKVEEVSEDNVEEISEDTKKESDDLEFEITE